MAGAGVAKGTRPGDRKQSSHRVSSPRQGRTHLAAIQGGESKSLVQARDGERPAWHLDLVQRLQEIVTGEGAGFQGAVGPAGREGSAGRPLWTQEALAARRQLPSCDATQNTHHTRVF